MIEAVISSEYAKADVERLIDEYGNSILRMCFMYLKDIHLAEDAMQDTFVKVYKNYSRFKGESSEKTWIMRIAINVCKNYQRTFWWKRIDLKDAIESAVINSDTNNLEEEDVLKEVMKLPRKYKEVILLFYYQEMKVKEVAEALDIKEATVATRLKRAREKLKFSLKGWYYDE